MSSRFGVTRFFSGAKIRQAATPSKILTSSNPCRRFAFNGWGGFAVAIFSDFGFAGFRGFGVAVENFFRRKILVWCNYSRHAESGLVNGRRVGFVRSRFGAVTARAASAGGRAGLFASARSRCAARPASPAAVTAARRCWCNRSAAISFGARSLKIAMMSARCVLKVGRCARMMPQRSSPVFGIGRQFVKIK